MYKRPFYDFCLDSSRSTEQFLHNYTASDYRYSRTSIKRPTFIWRPVVKVLEKLWAIHCNKNLYSMATSIKRPWPRGDFFVLYLYWTARKIWSWTFLARWRLRNDNVEYCKNTFSAVFIKTITKQSQKHFSLFVQHWRASVGLTADMLCLYSHVIVKSWTAL